MIQRADDGSWSAVLYPERARSVWSVAPPGPLAFACLWTTGSDPRHDRLVRAHAQRRGPDGSWQTLDALCLLPRAAEPAGGRLGREFGLTPPDLSAGREPGEVLEQLRNFLVGFHVLVPEREGFLAWLNVENSRRPLSVLGLNEIAALCTPGHFTSEGEGLCAKLLGREPESGSRALTPTHLRAGLGVLAASILARAEPARAVLAHTLWNSARQLVRARNARGTDVELVLALLEHPETWRDSTRALEPESYELRDGRLSAAAREFPDLATALDAAQPRWRRTPESVDADLPVLRLEEGHTLAEEDRRHVDEIFQEHLPRHFETLGASDASYRPGQHAVARTIASGFGRRELLLVHAPTGTGKTLAYLVPTVLWAVRHHARVGIATYTRVLQEQARERDVPLALECLRLAAGVQGARVVVLKGRENYLCWRALGLLAPASGEDPSESLAWSRVALFALHDEQGDLDRLSLRSPLSALDGEAFRRAAERVLRAVRSETGCCTLTTDRANCAAEAAWRAAERAHVVITNHALALARRDFFQHVVFDECEHLHDVALNAFSSAVSLRELGETITRLAAGERGPLERVAATAPEGSEASLAAERCLAVAGEARSALTALAAQCSGFKRWRAERAHQRTAADQHSLFREFASEAGSELLASHAALVQALAALAIGLAGLQETLEGAVPSREAPRLRRALEILRVELEEQRAAVLAWIPRAEGGRAVFGRESFHDLETTPSGEDVLVTRVLLPHEHLGRHYYPTLAGAVLISATTWLRGGFAAASAYLGLARAAEPAAEEEREPMPIVTFRAPEAFDYSRVLVAVPRDAPPVGDKSAYLDYCSRFIAFLAERTRGRLLALFTNAEDVAAVGQRLEPFLRARAVPLWWQRMRGVSKEELGQLFRARVDSVLLGLDTFWYGADFPGSTLEYLVLARLPFGVPDRYHHAQCAALGSAEQRRTIYLPRSLAKFRQGFGRLMRKESDRGCVYVLDRRLFEPRHREFLHELPLQEAWPAGEASAEDNARRSRWVLGSTDHCLEEGLAHMGLESELRRRDLVRTFEGWRMEDARP